MKYFQFFEKLIFTVFFLIFLGCSSDQEKVDLFVRNINVVDVVNNKIIKKQNVVIQNGRIREVGDKEIFDKFKSEYSFDGTGKFIMPGLWDNHVHFGGAEYIDENEQLLPLYIAMGVTTVRDAAGDISTNVLQWRSEIENRQRIGPRIFTSGPKIEGIASIWPGDIEVGTSAALQKAFDSLDQLKVDFVKVTDNTLHPQLFLEAIQEAVKRGYSVSGHLPATLSLQQLSEAGLTTIEHLGYALKAVSPMETEILEALKNGEINASEATQKRITTFDEETAVTHFKALAANGTGIVPTLSISKTIAYLDKDDHQDDAFLKYLGPKLKASYQWRVERAAKDSPEAIEARHLRFEKTASLLPIIQKSGMKIIAGTDAGYLNSYDYPGLAIHLELQTMVEYGLTPQQALKASIWNGPDYFGLLQDYGSIEKGKVADLLILNDNPLEDISHTQKISAVVRQGKLFDRNTLDALLRDIENWVKNKEAKSQ
jgi:imidazolonepropionase-like amidohydrolase